MPPPPLSLPREQQQRCLQLRYTDEGMLPLGALAGQSTLPLASNVRGLCVGALPDPLSGRVFEAVCWLGGDGSIGCHKLWEWEDTCGDSQRQPISRSVHGVARVVSTPARGLVTLRVEPDTGLGLASHHSVQTSEALNVGAECECELEVADFAAAELWKQTDSDTVLVVGATRVALLLPGMVQVCVRGSNSTWDLVLLPASAASGCFLRPRSEGPGGQTSSAILTSQAASSPPSRGSPVVAERKGGERAGGDSSVRLLLFLPHRTSQQIPPLPLGAAATTTEAAGGSAVGCVCAVSMACPHGPAAFVDVPHLPVQLATSTPPYTPRDVGAGSSAHLQSVTTHTGRVDKFPTQSFCLLDDALDSHRFALLRRAVVGGKRGEYLVWWGELDPQGVPQLSGMTSFVVPWGLTSPAIPVASCSGLLLFHSEEPHGSEVAHIWIGCDPSISAFSPLDLPGMCDSVRTACAALLDRFLPSDSPWT